MVEEVLNSMSSQQQPPGAERAPPAPSFAASVSSAAPATFSVPETGLYSLSYTVTLQPGSTCPYNLSLRTLDGDVEHIDQKPEPSIPGQPTDHQGSSQQSTSRHNRSSTP